MLGPGSAAHHYAALRAALRPGWQARGRVKCDCPAV